MARLAIVRADSIGEGNGRSWKKSNNDEIKCYLRKPRAWEKEKTVSLKHDLNSRLPRILACSRPSDSKAQSSDGGERVKSYAGKTTGKKEGSLP